jgi:hypothetical protein
MTSTASSDTVVLRHATAADDRALRDLAALDATRLGAGPHLVAEVDGRLRAAVSLHDRSAFADPFHPSAVHVQLLRARASEAGLKTVPRSRRRRRFGLPRGPRVAAA